MRAHVHDLDLVGRADHIVRYALVDGYAEDRLDGRRDGLDVLDVARADDINGGVADRLDVLPALLTLGPWDVRVGELADQGDGGTAGDDRLGLHLLRLDAAVLDSPPGNRLEPIEQRRSVAAAVRLDEAHDGVGPAIAPAVSLFEHLVRLPDARRPAQVDPAPAPRGRSLRLQSSQHLVAGRTRRVRGPRGHRSSPSRSRFSSSTFTVAAPKKPKNG